MTTSLWPVMRQLRHLRMCSRHPGAFIRHLFVLGGDGTLFSLVDTDRIRGTAPSAILTQHISY